MSFTEEEIDCIKSQPLARIATVAPDGQPDITAVIFEFDDPHFYISGFNPTGTRRPRNVRNGNHHAALIIDDLETVQPWTARFIRIYGAAELVDRDGQQILEITPSTSRSSNLSARWNLDMSHEDNPVRKTGHTPDASYVHESRRRSFEGC